MTEKHFVKKLIYRNFIYVHICNNLQKKKIRFMIKTESSLGLRN